MTSNKVHPFFVCRILSSLKNSTSEPRSGLYNIAPDDWVELENKTTMGLNEIDICKQIVQSINNIISIEEDKARYLALTENKK